VPRNMPRLRALPILTGVGLALAAAALVAITAMAALAAAPPNLSRAIEAQKQLAAERPQDAAVFNDLGNLLLLAHQPAEAEAAYRRAVEIDPKRASALFNLGLLLQQQGNLHESRQMYERVLAADPNHAWAHYELGTVFERRGDRARAVREYAQAFALDPQLAFREVNPQIVENRLVTESLLRAYERESAAAEAPSIYDEPGHIRDLLVQPPKEGTAEASPAGAAAQHPAVLRPKDLPTGNLGQATQPGGHTGNGAMQRGGVPVGVPGYQPPPPYTSVNPPPGARNWSRPIQPNPNMDGTQPGVVITPPPASIYYRPGQPSTGRLDSQLVPEENG
jgi:hypothetical protein